MICPIKIELDNQREERMKKQKIQREKQLDIFYRTGRPIYNITLDTCHLSSHNNPLRFIEPEIKCFLPKKK
jgi:hypothetical protein